MSRELHNDISFSNLEKSHKDLDKHFMNPEGIKDFNILRDDGMIIKIAEDNVIDKVINSFDKRRVILEKKASILHDYYGDSLVAKDIMKDYLSSKKWYMGTAHGFSLAIIGANFYSKAFNNSVFLGKFGTAISIVALQAGFRYLSNNSLEERISRPWKIHSYRMENGLGPTNTPINLHSEKLTSPLIYNVNTILTC